MGITYDPEKNERNVRERGLSFERVADFDFATAIYIVDDRQDYGERRIRSLGFLDGRLYALVYTIRDGDIRVISFRKAKKSEVARYEEAVRT
jgi:uncharacterized DUF497 family protein